MGSSFEGSRALEDLDALLRGQLAHLVIRAEVSWSAFHLEQWWQQRRAGVTQGGPRLTFPVCTSQVIDGTPRIKIRSCFCSIILKNKSVHLFCGDKENLVHKCMLVSGFQGA